MPHDTKDLSPAYPAQSSRSPGRDDASEWSALDEDARAFDVQRFVERLREARFLLIGLPLLGALIALGIAFARGPRFTSSASFLPQSEKPTSALSGLAAQFGVSTGVTDPGQSPAFYVDLIQSRAILGPVVNSPLGAASQMSRGTLAQYLVDHRIADSAELTSQGMERLRRTLNLLYSQKTAMVTVSATTRDPEISQFIVRRILDEVNRFNVETRRTQATAERRFADQRLASAATDLRAAEDALQSFLLQNREYQNAPSLMFEYDRLARAVSLRQQLYASIATSQEQAKMDEVRDTPVITIIETPNVPTHPDTRGWVKVIGFGVALGLFASIGIAWARSIS